MFKQMYVHVGVKFWVQIFSTYMFFQVQVVEKRPSAMFGGWKQNSVCDCGRHELGWFGKWEN